MSIQKGRQGAAGAYLVQLSRESQEVKESLEQKVRVRLQGCTVALMNEPRPEHARFEEGIGLMVLTVPDTQVSIQYLIDDEARKVKVYAILSNDAELNLQTGGSA